MDSKNGGEYHEDNIGELGGRRSGERRIRDRSYVTSRSTLYPEQFLEVVSKRENAFLSCKNNNCVDN